MRAAQIKECLIKWARGGVFPMDREIMECRLSARSSLKGKDRGCEGDNIRTGWMRR